MDQFQSAKDMYEALATDYSALHTSAVDRAEDAYIRKRVAAFIGAHDEVFDVGCGAGLFLDWRIPMRGYVGIDPADNMVMEAQRRHPERAFYRYGVEDVTRVKFWEGKFSRVIALFGSGGYTERAVLAEKVAYLLKPGGRFFLQINGPHYHDRPSYIFSEFASLLKPDVRPSETLRLFGARGLATERLSGFLSEGLERSLRVVEKVVDVAPVRLMEFEAEHGVSPERFGHWYWHLYEGVKYA